MLGSTCGPVDGPPGPGRDRRGHPPAAGGDPRRDARADDGGGPRPPRQKVAYHVRELEKAGLLRHVGQRQNGNFLEQVYEAVARTFVISPAATWGDAEARSAALADQVSLGELHRAGERLQRDSAVLLDRAAFDGEEVPSASVTTEIRFASDEARAAFLAEHLDALAVLVRKYGARSGTPYRIVLAAYPDPEADP